MQTKRKSTLGSLSGIVLGAVGIVGGLLLWKILKGHEYSLDSADGSVARAVKHLRTTSKNAKKVSPNPKASKVTQLLKVMKRGVSYTQVQLEKLTDIPYRSVRRYVDTLILQKKVASSGYGRGKVFKKV